MRITPVYAGNKPCIYPDIHSIHMVSIFTPFELSDSGGWGAAVWLYVGWIQIDLKGLFLTRRERTIYHVGTRMNSLHWSNRIEPMLYQCSSTKLKISNSSLAPLTQDCNHSTSNVAAKLQYFSCIRKITMQVSDRNNMSSVRQPFPLFYGRDWRRRRMLSV